MSGSTFQRVLDGVTSLAVLAVCVLILVQAVNTYNAPPAPVPAAGTTAPPASPAAGDHFAPVAGVDLVAAPKTLVFALQSSCHFCSESMPFYRELAQKRTSAVRFVVVAPDDLPAAKKYVSDNGFTPDAIATSDLPAIRVGGTPTLMLVNAGGVIERVWMGKLTAAREKEVLAEVSR